MKDGATPFLIHVVAHSGLFGAMLPADTWLVAHCRSENQPVQVTVGVADSAWARQRAAAQSSLRFISAPHALGRQSGDAVSQDFHLASGLCLHHKSSLQRLPRSIIDPERTCAWRK